MKILWLTNVPAPYRVDFFNELGKFCDLTVIFEKKTSDERDRSWLSYRTENFRGIFLKGKSINTDSAICFDVINYIKDKSYDEVVVTNISSPTGIIAISYMKMKGIEYWIEGDGGFAKYGNGLKNIVKKYLIKNAKGYFSTSKEHDEYYLTYGAKRERIYRYPFTSIKQEDIINADFLTNDDKKTLREQLNMAEEYIILSVGKLCCESDFELLMKVAELLGNRYGFYFFNHEPTDKLVERCKKNQLKNIHFINSLDKEDLIEYYAASNSVILLNQMERDTVFYEAMLFGLPIITTAECIEGNRLDQDRINIIFIEKDEEYDVFQKIKYLFEKEVDWKCSCADYNKLQMYTIDQMSPYSDELIHVWQKKRAIIRKMARVRLEIPNNKKIILFVGQMIHRKGIDVLMECAVNLSRLNDDYFFLFVGGECPKELEALYKLIPSDRIRFVTFLTSNELQYCYRAADIFCLLTREDIWGLVINEAMSHFLPVITTQYCIAGLELVFEDLNGHVVSLENTEHICEHISNALLKKEEYGLESHRIISGYTIENMVQRHIEVFSGCDCNSQINVKYQCLEK